MARQATHDVLVGHCIYGACADCAAYAVAVLGADAQVRRNNYTGFICTNPRCGDYFPTTHTLED